MTKYPKWVSPVSRHPFLNIAPQNISETAKAKDIWWKAWQCEALALVWQTIPQVAVVRYGYVIHFKIFGHKIIFEIVKAKDFKFYTIVPVDHMKC